MLAYPINGRLVHISKDGERTLCGRACKDWWVEDAPTDWAGHKSDCPQCGTPADFRVARDERDEASRVRAAAVAAVIDQRSALYQQRLAALEVLANEWVALVNERCPDGVFAVARGHGVTTITSTVMQGDFSFDVIVKVKI